MKIGVMLRHYEQHEGGIKVYTHKVIEHILPLGTEHEFVLMYANHELIGTYNHHPHVKEVAVRLPVPTLWDQLVPPWLERCENFDIVFNPKFAVPFACRANKVFNLHGSEWFTIPNAYPWYFRLYHQLFAPLYCRRSEAFITVSNTVKRDVLEHIDVQPEKVTAIHNGYDRNQFRPIDDEGRLETVRRKYHLPRSFIYWTGQLYPPKNVGRLLRAFARLKDDFPHALVLGGERRWRYKEEARIAAELGIEDRIVRPGWVEEDDLAALYNLADLFAFPSLYEGFGLPIVEAMACGCPVLTATTGSPPEVTDGAAELVKPLEVADIERGLRRVLSDAELRKRMREKGLERAQDFSWERCARETLTLLENTASIAKGNR